MAKFLDTDGLTYLWSQIKSKLSTKVDIIDGKSLSTNDYTTEEKTKLANASENGHTHVKSDVTDFPTSLKNPNALTVTVNGTATSYDGSVKKSITITASDLGISDPEAITNTEIDTILAN